MANPLALYVPIIQDDDTVQGSVKDLCREFPDLVGAGLKKYGLVHYALLTPIPTANGAKTDALLLTTSFDDDMEPYLDTFWKDAGTKFAFQQLAKIARIEVADVETFDGFQRFIVENNLAKDPKSLYNAYPWSVADIKGALPTP